MNILHTVEFYHPSTGGAQEVVQQLSEHMINAGHNVTVATSYLSERKSNRHNGVLIKSFKISGNQVRGYIGNTEEYTDFIKTSNFDVVMNYAAQQWATDLVFSLLPKIKAKKIFVPCGFSGLYDPEYIEYFNEMPKILSYYDSIIFLASKYRDINFARKHNIGNLHIIPNGADKKEFLTIYQGNIRKELGISDKSLLILHVGSFTGMKGHMEAIKIFEKTNITNTTLLMVGNVLDHNLIRRLKKKALTNNVKISNLIGRRRILIFQLDRARTVAAYQSADLFIFPSNIEASPLVLFEACASRTPFLTTNVGNSKEIIKWTKGGVLMPTTISEDGLSHANIEESARVLGELLKDVQKRHELADCGYSAWIKKYNWEIISKEYLDIYRRDPE